MSNEVLARVDEGVLPALTGEEQASLALEVRSLQLGHSFNDQRQFEGWVQDYDDLRRSEEPTHELALRIGFDSAELAIRAIGAVERLGSNSAELAMGAARKVAGGVISRIASGRTSDA